MAPVGWVKDGVAATMFLVSLMMLYSTEVPKSTVIRIVGMGLAVDTLFTINRDWHCEEWNESLVAKYVVLFQVVFFCANIPM